MVFKQNLRQLLTQSQKFYVDEYNGLSLFAKEASKGLFTGGALWMMQVLRCLRNKTRDFPKRNYEILGLFKYGMALLLGFLAGYIVWDRSSLAAVIVFILVFYAVEAQFVFLFPLAIDRSPRLIRSSLSMTQRAGGTFEVMRIVLPVAATMLFGGFAGKGYLRSWCIGCIAIVIWYEALQKG